jgi:hypothetical protein
MALAVRGDAEESGAAMAALRGTARPGAAVLERVAAALRGQMTGEPLPEPAFTGTGARLDRRTPLSRVNILARRP